MEDNGGAKFLYFLAGLGIGAVVGILFAPQSGQQTRDMIADRAEESRDYLLRRGRDLREQATGYVEKGKEAVAHQREHLTAAIEAGKQAYRAESQSKGSTD